LNDINTVYASGSSSGGLPSVYKTANAGTSWTSVFTTTNNQNIKTGLEADGGDYPWYWGEFAMGFTVDPLDSTKVIITDEGWAHLSSDGGVNWQNINTQQADLNPAGAVA